MVFVRFSLITRMPFSVYILLQNLVLFVFLAFFIRIFIKPQDIQTNETSEIFKHLNFTTHLPAPVTTFWFTFVLLYILNETEVNVQEMQREYKCMICVTLIDCQISVERLSRYKAEDN